MDLLANLAIRGEGVAFLPRSRYAKQVAAGELEVLNTKPESPEVGFYFVYPQDAGDMGIWFSRSVLDVCASVLGTERTIL
jgi:DNA-binding transcriptional LysR family regulator